MAIYLLANIGNSDLYIPDNDLPEKRMPSRKLGEEVNANFEKYRTMIELPLIEPTISYIREAESCEAKDIHFILFTSDQNQQLVDEDSWSKDTHPVGEAIQNYLNAKFGIAKKQIKLLPIKGNPADYVNALEFHRTNLLKIASDLTPEDKVFLEISGGTPAMTAMLLAMGVDVFGARVTTTLYIDRGSPEANVVPVAEALLAIKMRDLIRQQIRLYAYKAAQQTLELSGQYVAGSESRRALLNALLAYGDRRLAFDMADAREALSSATASGELQAQITFWRREFTDKNIAKSIEEVIHSAKIKAEQGEYADFTQRLFRFQEETLRYMADQQGIEYSNKSRQFVKSEWRVANPDFDKFLSNYRRDSLGRTANFTQSVDTNRSLNRFSLGAIVDYFVQTDEWAKWKPAAERIFRLSTVADLRNKGLAGHGFDGISEADIQDAYGSSPDQLIQDLCEIYEMVFGVVPARSPYEILNRYISDLLEAAP